MRQPDEIKKGLEFDIGCCSNCHECYSIDNPYGCEDRAHQIAVAEDALSYIRQLEAQVPKWISAKEPPKEWRKNDKEKVLINYLVYMPGYGVDVGNWVEPVGKWVVMGIPANVTHYMPLPEGPKEG